MVEEQEMKSQRILLVLNILRRKTNRTVGITLAEIKDIFEEEQNMIVHRMTIKKDLEFLKEKLGYPIIQENRAHNKAYYYLIPEFGNSEIRVLLDSLGTNKFVSNEEKKKLGQHILKFASGLDEKKLRNTVKTSTIVENGKDIICTLQILHEAIEDERYVAFEYGKFQIDKEIHPIGKSYKVIPKEIYYYNNRYYLIALKDGELRNFRVDRILKVRIEEYHYQVGKINLERYDLINFDMFGAKIIEKVQLRVKKNLLDSIIERFGKEVNIKNDETDSEYFIVTENLGINQGLVRWILKQGSSMQVIMPQTLKEQIKEEIIKMNKLYE